MKLRLSIFWSTPNQSKLSKRIWELLNCFLPVVPTMKVKLTSGYEEIKDLKESEGT